MKFQTKFYTELIIMLKHSLLIMSDDPKEHVSIEEIIKLKRKQWQAEET